MRTRWTSRLETIYKGSPGDIKPLDKYPPVEVSGDLVECPVCHAGVRSVIAIFSDPTQRIVRKKTRVYGSHRYGGHMATGGMHCLGAGRMVR